VQFSTIKTAVLIDKVNPRGYSARSLSFYSISLPRW
jgi:hypothetical protein